MTRPLSRRSLSRRVLLAALVLLAPSSPVWAAGKPTEIYVKMTSIVLEFWDSQGLFHVVNIELSAVFPSQTTMNKKVSDKIAQNLSAMTWEDFSHGNPAATVKAVALDVLRKDPTTAKATEVLLIKMMAR